ncbi:MAG: uracil-DNA glycosylase [Candidatus Atribacteria bacterium]|nr:uracil-DNA glycosylase [Candidatus Atribacteria bacterium]
MNKESTYNSILEDILNCTKCALCRSKTHYVPGDGPLDSRVAFIGEGPGREEDAVGHPFVGAAGRLLTELLKEIDMQRDEVFIGNIVKCRPPNNRTPLPEEVDACLPYLFAQISVIDPEVIVLLGNTPISALLSPQYKVSAIHGRIFEKEGFKFFVTFHPAAALYHGEYKELLRKDFLKLKEILNATKNSIGGF